MNSAHLIKYTPYSDNHKKIKEMEDICPLLCGSLWLPQGYQGLLMIDCALLYSDDHFSGSKLHSLHVAM